MNGYRVYEIWCGVKAHYTDARFSIWENDLRAPNASVESFARRNDQHFFNVLARTYTHPRHLVNLFSASLQYKDDWVGAMVEEEARQRFLKRLGFLRSIEVHCKEEIEKMFSLTRKVETLFNSTEHTQPRIWREVNSGRIGIEPYCVVNKMYGFDRKALKNYNDDKANIMYKIANDRYKRHDATYRIISKYIKNEKQLFSSLNTFFKEKIKDYE